MSWLQSLSLEIALVVGLWQLVVQLTQLWREFDCVQQFLRLLLEIVESVGIFVHIIQLVLEGALARDKTIAIDAFLDDFLIQQCVAAGPQSGIRLEDHSDQH